MNAEDIPYFEDQVDKMIPDQSIVYRSTISAVVYNPETDEILCMKWNKLDWKTLVNGGIDDGEDVIEASKREIREETGYKDLKFITEIGKVRSGFYAKNAKENRITTAVGLIFELVSSERDHIDDLETSKHISEWVKKDEAASFVNIDWQLYLLNIALNSGFLVKSK